MFSCDIAKDLLSARLLVAAAQNSFFSFYRPDQANSAHIPEDGSPSNAAPVPG